MAEKQDQLQVNSATPIGSGRFYYQLDTNKGTYYYTPTEFLNQGLLQGSTQYFDQGFLRNPDVTKNLQGIELAPGILQDKIMGLYSNANRGVLMTQDQASKVLGGGSSTFSDWNNVINGGGYVDRYDINQINSNTGSPFGPIGGMSEFQGSLVYTRPTEAHSNYSYIIPYDKFDTGWSARNTNITVEKKGGALGSLIRGIGNVFGELGPLGDIAAYYISPALYGVVKGGQAASAGMDPLQAGLQTGLTVGLTEGIKSLIPSITAPETAPVEPGIPIGEPAVPDITSIAPEVAPGIGTEVTPIGDVISPEITPIPPQPPLPTQAPISVETLANQILQEKPPVGPVIEPGVPPEMGAPAPIEQANIPTPKDIPEPTTGESIWDLVKTAGETAYGLASDYPLTTLGLAMSASGAGEKPPEQVAESEPPPKTYEYRAPIEFRQPEGLKQTRLASEGIYGLQRPTQIPSMPEQPAFAPISAQPQLLAGNAPVGISALKQTFTPVFGGPSVDISKMSIDQLIQLQNALEAKRQLGIPT